MENTKNKIESNPKSVIQHVVFTDQTIPVRICTLKDPNGTWLAVLWLDGSRGLVSISEEQYEFFVQQLFRSAAGPK